MKKILVVAILLSSPLLHEITVNDNNKLIWKNNQGLTFEKEISLDNQYLFTIKQRVINSTNKKSNIYDFWSFEISFKFRGDN